MLNVDDITGEGFTIVVSDNTFDTERTQESIDAMFEGIREVLRQHGFDISIVASNEDAMKFQGKILFETMFAKIQELL